MKSRMLILGLSSCALMIASSQAQGFTMNAATPMPVLQEPQAPPAQTRPLRPRLTSRHAEPGSIESDNVHRHNREGWRELCAARLLGRHLQAR